MQQVLQGKIRCGLCLLGVKPAVQMYNCKITNESCAQETNNELSTEIGTMEFSYEHVITMIL